MPVGPTSDDLLRSEDLLSAELLILILVSYFSISSSYPSSMAYQRLVLEEFAKLGSTTGRSIIETLASVELTLSTEISSVALGGSVTSVSDDFFAEAFHLLLVEASPLLNFEPLY